MAAAVASSLAVHALVLSLDLHGGEEGWSLPGLQLPWRERRAEVPPLSMVVLAPPAPAAPALANRAADPGVPAAAPVDAAAVPAAVDAGPAAIVAEHADSQPPADRSPVMAVEQATPAELPVHAHHEAAPVAEPPARAAAVAAASAAAAAASAAAAAQVEARAAEAQARREREAQLEKQAQAAAQEQAVKEQAAREQAAREEAAAQEAARLEHLRAAAAEAARLAAERERAVQAEALRRESARQAAEREEAARELAAREEAARQEAARQEATRQEAARQEAVRLAQARARAAEAEADNARREAARRAMGRQLDEEAARRDAAAAASRSSNDLPYSWSSARRGRIFGRTDANAELAFYAEAWARRVHLNTAVEAFREAASRPHRSPLVTVAVRSDGSVESVTLVVASGVAELDEAIRRIVMALAPYPAFAPALAREFDVVEIRRTWTFDAAVRLH